jgi:hypothetical protein
MKMNNEMIGPLFLAMTLCFVIVAAVAGLVWAYRGYRGKVSKSLLVLAAVFWLASLIAVLLEK